MNVAHFVHKGGCIMLRKVLCIVLAVAFALVSVGCGGSGNDLDGRWEAGRNAYEFSGSNFTRHTGALSPSLVWHTITTTGTFSISDDYIEFVYEDGRIVVRPFSRTENTILMDQTRYTRASGSGGSTAPAPALAAPATPAAPAPTAGGHWLDGRWETPDHIYYPSTGTRLYWAMEFSGDSVVEYMLDVTFPDDMPSDEWYETNRGTFSIHGNQMVVIFAPNEFEPNERTHVWHFMHIDENTFVFDDGIPFNRVR